MLAKRLMVVLLLGPIFGVAGIVGCASQSIYQSWGNQLVAMPTRNGTKDDVSLLLGAPPERCDPVSNPTPLIGIYFSTKVPIVASVVPTGAAYEAGIRPGDTVLGVDGVPAADGTQVLTALRGSLHVGQPSQIQTNRGVFSVIPRMPNIAEQCYWNVSGGAISQSASGAYVNQYSGSASSASYDRQRFFRSSCRVNDNYISTCSYNWQQ